ncbi:putative membrane protein [[Clostridium] sordellii ATCC 9714]|nr:putative membrane protein [[Clostridium] sordellii ATCC 9714] [Paeniclostridium sordellii ATCC 9714]
MGDIIEKYNSLTGWIIISIISFIGVSIMIFLEKFTKIKIN